MVLSPSQDGDWEIAPGKPYVSRYRIIVRRDTSAIVQGGRFFPDATPGRIDGSGFGGSFLKVGWIGIGLRMEIFADGRRIITSPVRDISIQRHASATVN